MMWCDAYKTVVWLEELTCSRRNSDSDRPKARRRQKDAKLPRARLDCRACTVSSLSLSAT